MSNRISRAYRLGNNTYKQRHGKKSAKGQGIYADQLPGLPRGVHDAMRKSEDPCQCGRCNPRRRKATP
jgi:hypothetical protein